MKQIQNSYSYRYLRLKYHKTPTRIVCVTCALSFKGTSGCNHGLGLSNVLNLTILRFSDHGLERTGNSGNSSAEVARAWRHGVILGQAEKTAVFSWIDFRSS